MVWPPQRQRWRLRAQIAIFRNCENVKHAMSVSGSRRPDIDPDVFKRDLRAQGHQQSMDERLAELIRTHKIDRWACADVRAAGAEWAIRSRRGPSILPRMIRAK